MAGKTRLCTYDQRQQNSSASRKGLNFYRLFVCAGNGCVFYGLQSILIARNRVALDGGFIELFRNVVRAVTKRNIGVGDTCRGQNSRKIGH